MLGWKTYTTKSSDSNIKPNDNDCKIPNLDNVTDIIVIRNIHRDTIGSREELSL